MWAAVSVQVVGEAHPLQAPPRASGHLFKPVQFGMGGSSSCAFGVTGAPHPTLQLCRLRPPAGQCPHPLPLACSISNPFLVHLDLCGFGKGLSDQANASPPRWGSRGRTACWAAAGKALDQPVPWARRPFL